MYKQLSVVIILTLCSCNSNKSENKFVFVDSKKLFEEFKMKKDYDKKLEDDLKIDAISLDSINVIMKSTTDSNYVYSLRKDYYLLEQVYNSKFEKLSSRYTSIVGERLNEYIKKYSELKKYDIVISGGNGGVLFVSEGKDLTNEYIKYSNDTYIKE